MPSVCLQLQLYGMFCVFALTFGEHTTKPTFKLVFQLTGTHMRVTQAALQRKAEGTHNGAQTASSVRVAASDGESGFARSGWHGSNK